LSYKKRIDILSEDRIKSVIKTSLFAQKIYAFWSISTTNDFAYRMALQGDKEGTLVIAEKQIRGRGRKSRTWDSSFSKGLWFSLILRPEMPSHRAGLIPFIASVSIAEAIENKLNLQPDMKWPNDLLLGGKKCCGILSEAEFVNNKIKFIILGIGINVNHNPNDFPDELKNIATSLRIQSEKRVDRADLLAEILFRLEQNYQNIKVSGFEETLSNWKRRCSKFKKRVVIEMEGQKLSGKFIDLDEGGGLILKTEKGEQKKVVAGDLIY